MSTPLTKMTGEEVGRLIIKDLALIYKQAHEGGPEAALLSTEQKFELVNSLTEPAEVAAYNDYRYFHEFLSRAALLFNVHLQHSEACYWRLMRCLELIHLAEMENKYWLTLMPRIMTTAQYEQSRNLFNPTGGQDFGRGVALVEWPGFPPQTYKIDKSGHYQYPIPSWREQHLLENYYSLKDEAATQLANYRTALKEALIIRATVDIAAHFLEMPDLTYLVDDVDLSQIDQLNQLMIELPQAICRRGLRPDEKSEQELQNDLREVLRPIDIKSLKPTAKARAKARRAMNFEVGRGHSEQFYAILRQGDE